MPIKLGATNFGNIYLGSTKIGEAYLGSVKVYGSRVDPYNPLNLPQYTMRFQFSNPSANPTGCTSKGVWTQVSSSPNVWDFRYNGVKWQQMFYESFDPYYFNGTVQLLGANTAGITMMYQLFDACPSLTSVVLFDTSKITNANYMFANTSITTVPQYDLSNVTMCHYMFSECENLTTVPSLNLSSAKDTSSMFISCHNLTTVGNLITPNVEDISQMFSYCTSLPAVPYFNTSKCTDANFAFFNCTNVSSGALAMYNQMSGQATPPTRHHNTFYNCGANTVSGQAELAQIPSDWVGDGSLV